jgi:hypothetical protein
MEPDQPIHVCPKYQRHGNHFETDFKQFGVTVVAPLYQQPRDEK